MNLVRSLSRVENRKSFPALVLPPIFLPLYQATLLSISSRSLSPFKNTYLSPPVTQALSPPPSSKRSRRSPGYEHPPRRGSSSPCVYVSKKDPFLIFLLPCARIAYIYVLIFLLFPPTRRYEFPPFFSTSVTSL